MKTIWIYGVGGVGGVIGGKIAHAIKNKNLPYQVFFIARGEHLNQIKQNGLILNTTNEQNLICHPHFASSHPEEFPAPDLVFICVKSYDLKSVSLKLKNLIQPHTILIPLLNGIDIYDQIKKFLTTGILLPSCIYIGTHIEKPGTVTQKGGEGKILTGPDPKHSEFDPDQLTQFFNKNNINYQWFNDSKPSIWEKFIFIASFGLVTAAYNKTIGEVLSHPDLKQTVHHIMKEIVLISQQKKISLSQNIIENAFLKAASFSPETKTSFQRDYEQKDFGKNNEKDLFGLSILNLGKEFNIPTPITEKVFKLL